MHNLLIDPLIRVRRSGDHSAAMSLPEVYEAASTDDIAAFPALRPHQRHAWHAFLAQLGAMAIQRAGRSEPARTASEWRSLLRDLTPGFGNDEPWRLIVGDPELPAFMQSPAVGGLDAYRRRVATPDDLDILVTSKNHDVKQAIAIRSAPEDWVFALVDLQTMAGFLGAGNYGIARMNGGFSARPCLGLAPADGGFGAHLFRDIQRMLDVRASVLQKYGDYYRSTGGKALLWLEPWDGTSSLDLGELDPYFIETCRRVRLRAEGGGVVALSAASKTARVAAKSARGNVGDFWTPVDVKDAKALSLPSAGFRYDRLAKLLFDRGAYELPPAMGTEAAPGSARWRLVARGVAGGQGKTDGYHERNDIVFSGRTTAALGRRRQRDLLADLSEAQLEEVAAVASALRTGIAVAASGGKRLEELRKADRAHAGPYVRRFDAEVDSGFFAALDRRFVAADDAARKAERAGFATATISAADGILHEAVEVVSCPAIRRHRARARALSAFHGRLRGPRSVFADQPEIFGVPEAGNGD